MKMETYNLILYKESYNYESLVKSLCVFFKIRMLIILTVFVAAGID